MPNVIEELRELDLSEEERQGYQAVCNESKNAIDDAVSNKATVKAYHGIIQAIMRLRLFCNHGIVGASSPSLFLDDDLSCVPDELNVSRRDGNLPSMEEQQAYDPAFSPPICADHLPLSPSGIRSSLCQQPMSSTYFAAQLDSTAIDQGVGLSVLPSKIRALVDDIEANVDGTKW